jgi:small basic protein
VDVSFETFFGYFTGLRVFGGNLSLPSLLVTAFVVHCLDSLMCRLFARNNNYPKNLWTVLGFFFGIWAVIALVFLPKEQRE